MKNLSIQEKRDLDTCVFQTLGKKEKCQLALFFNALFSKIKTLFSKN
ncbi:MULTISPECIES: hypothetical protein [unclassified Campylobacter]|nr:MULTISPECIES: hypothetical protein [unclassified Campylobacter]KAA8604259.1 hypothetical protein CGP82_03460 [Campylobacter sp. LR185c]